MNKPAAFIVVENGQTWLRTSAETEEAIRTGFIMETVPLYTAPTKREPLSDAEIFEIGYKAGFAIDGIERELSLDYGFLDEDGDVDNEPYFKLVRAIEKAHGITGGGE